MIHLPSLQVAAAGGRAALASLINAAVGDALTLEQAGFDAVLVQNSLDRPTRATVSALALAQVTTVTMAVRQSVSVSVGVNVIKNDGAAAAAAAVAAGADFIRVKVLTGAALSAEGILAGCAAEVHDVLSQFGGQIDVWADVYEPTSRPLISYDMASAVVDAIDFGAADVLIVTGHDGQQTLDLAAAAASPGRRVAIGGKIDVTTVRAALDVADSVILGSALKREPGIRGRVDAAAAASLVEAAG